MNHKKLALLILALLGLSGTIFATREDSTRKRLQRIKNEKYLTPKTIAIAAGIRRAFVAEGNAGGVASIDGLMRKKIRQNSVEHFGERFQAQLEKTVWAAYIPKKKKEK